jgi:putative aldouronate transport system permease protein
MAVSFSDSSAAMSGRVSFWPINFTIESYRLAFQKPRFFTSMYNSLLRVAVGVSVNMALTILVAYPLSKAKSVFKGRTFFAWFFVITMLVGGGMIPTYLIVTWTGLRNTIWAMILPGAVPIYNMVIMLNFFRQIPHELEESAYLDGAGDFRILLQIFLPLSMPCIATLIIFLTVGHWNDWFSGMVYMDRIDRYPLATYLHNVLQRPDFDKISVMTPEERSRMLQISPRTLTNAQITMSTIPIIMIYPFLQRFFVKGMTLGSLKG